MADNIHHDSGNPYVMSGKSLRVWHQGLARSCERLRFGRLQSREEAFYVLDLGLRSLLLRFHTDNGVDKERVRRSRSCRSSGSAPVQTLLFISSAPFFLHELQGPRKSPGTDASCAPDRTDTCTACSSESRMSGCGAKLPACRSTCITHRRK